MYSPPLLPQHLHNAHTHTLSHSLSFALALPHTHTHCHTGTHSLTFGSLTLFDLLSDCCSLAAALVRSSLCSSDAASRVLSLSSTIVAFGGVALVLCVQSRFRLIEIVQTIARLLP